MKQAEHHPQQTQQPQQPQQTQQTHPSQRPQQPQRLKRSESFLGIHFDFHAREDCTRVGERTTEAMVQHILDKVRPDYVQCDCKGHPGIASYPTKVGTPAPGIIRDSLRIWRDVTARSGVSLYVHYSGVWDTQAIREHPEWARVDENGQVDPNNTSTFGPYVDRLLIPQLKELSDDYDIDGVWVDGECWATCHDYGPDVIARFQQETGISDIPQSVEDPNWRVFADFCRDGFRRYLRHYVNALHAHRADFEIASNWAFSSMMPEPVSVDVDFLSGDFTLQDSVRSARLEGRCLAGQGKPWDLMAWAFSSKWGEGCFSTKSPMQLKQEAAVVLALGGGFQAYFTQKRDASLSIWQMDLMAEVAQFCRERQSISHRNQPVPQIALFLSTEDFYQRNKRLFAAWDNLLLAFQGVLDGLLDNQYGVEILMDHHLERDVSRYPLVVLPESVHIGDRMAALLRGYVRNGGHLLVIGAAATSAFREDLGVSFADTGAGTPANTPAATPEEKAPDSWWLEHNGWLAGMKTVFQPVVPIGEDTYVMPIGRVFRENDNIGTSHPAAVIRTMGKGKIGGVLLDFGERYVHAKTPTARDFLGSVVHALFPDPLVRVTGSHHVDVVPAMLDDRLTIHLVNTGGPHADKDVYVYDDIPPAGPLTLSIRCPQAPRALILEPAHQLLDYTWEEGIVTTTIARLDIHAVVVVEAWTHSPGYDSGH